MVSPTAARRRPGRVARLRGIIFRSDGASAVGSGFIRPFETLDRRLAKADRPAPSNYPALAMHAGLHVVMEDGRELVAEQTVRTLRDNFSDGLYWTSIADFRERDRGGWDVTVPATAFRGIDEAAVARAVERLNEIKGRAYMGEDCTAFIERVFERRLFADSPLLAKFGLSVRIGDPALPLLRPDVSFDKRTADLVRSDVASQLPDAVADPESPNIRVWGRVLAVVLAVSLAAGGVTLRVRHRRRSTIARLPLVAALAGALASR